MILEIFCFECNKICLNFGKFIFAVLYFFHYSEISTKNMFFKKNVLFTKLSLMIFFKIYYMLCSKMIFPQICFLFHKGFFFHKKVFLTNQYFSHKTFFLTKQLFSHKTVFCENFFLTKQFFSQNIFLLTKLCFASSYVLAQKCFGSS